MRRVDPRYVIEALKYMFWPLALLGLADMAIQAFTKGEFRLIHRILSLIF